METSSMSSSSLPSYLLLFFFFSFSGCILFLLLHRRRQNEKKHLLPPGRTGWPVVGCFPMMLREKAPFKWLLREAAGKDIWCAKLGATYAVVVNTPELGREFLKAHDANFSSRPLTVATEYMSRGYLSTAFTPWGDQWRKMRRVVVGELLTPARLRSQAAARTEEADNLVRYLFRTCKTSSGTAEPAAVVDVRLVLRYYTGCILRRLVFGKRHLGISARDGGGPEDAEHIDAALILNQLLYSFCISDYLPWLRWLDLDGHERRVRAALEVMNKYQDPIVEERVKWWRSSGVGDDGRKKAPPEDFLDIMATLTYDDGKPLLTLEEIKAEICEMIIGTVDNPPSLGEWLISEMLNQPDILKKAMAELDRVVGRDRLVQESDFNDLPYIRACCRETLRLHPVAPFNLPHVSMADDTVAGYFIPKGSHVLLSRIGLNRNPAVWDDPLPFNPERHFKEGGRTDLAEPELRFFSFGFGRRSCVGASLGSLMIYMLVGRLLQAFTWELPMGVDVVDLEEEEKGFLKARPLHACIRPRLSIVDNI